MSNHTPEAPTPELGPMSVDEHLVRVVVESGEVVEFLLDRVPNHVVDAAHLAAGHRVEPAGWAPWGRVAGYGVTVRSAPVVA